MPARQEAKLVRQFKTIAKPLRIVKLTDIALTIRSGFSERGDQTFFSDCRLQWKLLPARSEPDQSDSDNLKLSPASRAGRAEHLRIVQIPLSDLPAQPKASLALRTISDGEGHDTIAPVLATAYFACSFNLPSALFFSRNAPNFSPASRSRIYCS